MDGFIHQASIATAIQIYAILIAVPPLQNCIPGFSDAQHSQSLSETDITISVNFLEINNTEKNCSSEHGSKRRKSLGVREVLYLASQCEQ